MMKSVGLFCGSFNPIHIGHTHLAQFILDHCGLDEIWFIVSPHNPMKLRSDLLDEQIRLKMVNLAISHSARLFASDVEFTLPKPSYTVNTLRFLSEAHQDIRFSLIIGSDNLSMFDSWREYEYIMQNYNIIVYPRKGDDISSLLKLYPKVQVVEAPLLPISSTQIREMIVSFPLKDNPAIEWLSPDVWQFISENNLYH